MLQQRIVEKTEKRFSFLDGLFADTTARTETRKDIDYLSEDYVAAVRIAANLSSHARWIPYPFLLNRIRKIADEVRAQAEALRAKIVELGGQTPSEGSGGQGSAENRDIADFRQNVKRFVMDMEEHAFRSEVLVHQKNKMGDAGVVKLIDSIISDMQRQKDELLDIVMRLA